MFWGRGSRKDLAARLRCQSAPLSTRLSPERHRQHTPRATRTRTRGGGAAFGVMNSPPRTQRTSSTARRSPGSGPRGRYKWMMAAYLWGEILADVCMMSFIFHCCAGEPPLIEMTGHRDRLLQALALGLAGTTGNILISGWQLKKKKIKCRSLQRDNGTTWAGVTWLGGVVVGDNTWDNTWGCCPWGCCH